MEKSGKFRLTSLERNWILYDVGNSAFVLMVATLIPIFFNALAESGGLSSVEYLAYWGYASSAVTVITAVLSPILGTVADTKGFKKPMSDRAITLMMNKLESLSHDKHEQVQILNQSIMQGWTGLFALKDVGKSRGQPRNVNPNGFANFKQTDHSEQLGQLEKMLADELNNNK